jgi:hypothetical protein
VACLETLHHDSERGEEVMMKYEDLGWNDVSKKTPPHQVEVCLMIELSSGYITFDRGHWEQGEPGPASPNKINPHYSAGHGSCYPDMDKYEWMKDRKMDIKRVLHWCYFPKVEGLKS